METTKRNCMDNGMRRRFFGWAKDKITGEEAFEIFYGERGEKFPAEMKRDFIALFDQGKAMMQQLHKDRETFMDKWDEYTGKDQEQDFMGHEHFHGQRPTAFGQGPGFPGQHPMGYGEGHDFHGRCGGFPGGHGFFGR